MPFPHPVAIGISRPLFRPMLHRQVDPAAAANRGKAGRFITVENAAPFGGRFHHQLHSPLLRIGDDLHADLTGLPPCHSYDRRSIIGKDAAPTPLVGPPP